MSRIFLLVFFNTLLCYTACAQGVPGYIQKDSVYLVGFLTKKNTFNNNRSILFSKYDTPDMDMFRPKDLVEYGFQNGDIYFTRLVRDGSVSNYYFLKRLVKGEMLLYELKVDNGYRLFGEGNGKFIELKKDSLNKGLSLLFKREGEPEPAFIQKARFSKSSLVHSFTHYNLTENGKIKLPSISKGILVGMSYGSFTVNPYYTSERVLLNGVVSPFFGVFVDFPLDMKSHWFLSSQLFYQKAGYSFYKEDSYERLDYSVNTSSITLPLLFQRKLVSKKLNPLIGFGPAFTYYLDMQGGLYTTKKYLSGDETTKTELNMSKLQIGATAYLGAEFPVLNKNTFLELRYYSGMGFSGKNGQIVSSIQLTFGIDL